MLGMSTGRYSIIRGVQGEPDEYGHSDNSDEAVQKHVQGSVIEKMVRDYDEVSGKVSTVIMYTGRFSYTVDIEDGDRIRDEKSGRVFLVEKVSHGTNFLGKSDVKLDLSSVE